MPRHPLAALVAATTVAASLTAFAADDIVLELPADYKSYANYFTGDRQNGKQVIALYANDVAIDGARSTGELPYGSILVGELIPAVEPARDF